MVTEGDQLEVLALQVLAIAREKLTGTIRVVSAEEATKQIVFVQGFVADIDTGRDDTVLEAGLLNTGGFADKDLKRARKTAAKKKVSIGTALLELDLLEEDVIVESVQQQVMGEVCGVFDWEVASHDFIEHADDERLETFYSDLTDHVEIYIDGEEVFLDGARRLGRWDLVASQFGMLHDVYYATPSSFKYFHEQDYPEERAIIGAVDGIKDVEEVIAAASQDPFAAFNVVRKLMAANELELINPVQMYQLGVEASSGDNLEKAVKLFRRAHERGLDDFDLQLKLAQTYEGLGRKQDATNWYVLFGEKCQAQLRFDEAIRCLRKAVRLDPDRIATRENLMTLLFQNNRREEGIEELIGIAERKAAKGNKAGALTMLLEHQGDEDKDPRVQKKLIEIAESAGNTELANREREALAKSLELRKDVEAALEVYQMMYCDGDDSIDVRLKLVDLHRKRGNRQKALDHIRSILNTPEKRGVRDLQILEHLHETVRELRPADNRSNQWLVDRSIHAGDEKRAAQILIEWIGHLEREGDTETVEHAYHQLISIDDRADHRWGLASTMEKLGRHAEAQRELRCLANLALRRKDFDQSMKAVDYILKQAPFDLETRKMQVELYEAQGSRDLAVQKCREVAQLHIIAGNVQEAEQFCRRLLVNHPDDAEMVTRLGQLCQESGDRRKAAEQFLKAAKIHLEGHNYGLGQSALEKLLALEPGHQEGLALLEEIKARERGGAPVAAASPAPSPAAAPAGGVASQEASREYFATAAPVTTNVSKSMARLKNLKSEGSKSPPSRAPAPAAAARTAGRTAKSRIADITSRLRSLKGGPGENVENESPPEAPPVMADAPAAAPAADSSTPLPGGAEKVEWRSEVEIPTANDALQAAASRLRALASGKSRGADAGSGAASPQAEATASGNATKKLKLGSAASKLAALRSAPATESADETTETEDASVESVTR